jgi:predicted Zn-dependent protease with MMP-like domain
MPESSSSESFEEIVQWAYSTLPQKIRDLPDFPGIQVVEEPPDNVLKDVAKRKNWPNGTEMLGLYSGIRRTEPQHFRNRIAPDLIFVFRGPILRCSKGDLRAEVKQTVWHEVAHWLGHNEEEVRDLGLSFPPPPAEDATQESSENQAPRMLTQQTPKDTVDDAEKANEQPRCIKCYSTDVTCHDVERPLSYAGANSFDPITVHARSCKCNSCDYEWDDEDTA